MGLRKNTGEGTKGDIVLHLSFFYAQNFAIEKFWAEIHQDILQLNLQKFNIVKISYVE